MRTKLLAVLALLAVAAGGYFYFRDRIIRVWVYTDYAFRFQHTDWPALVESRFAEVNRIYKNNGTGVRWKVLDASKTDPNSDIPGIDNRRANMVFHQDRDTDVYVIITGVREGDRTGSVSPFTNVAVVEDFADKPESINARLMAHELAHLFGAPHDPTWLETLMGNKPESEQFSPRTVATIRTMRGYPFANGIDGILKGSWRKTAVSALVKDDTSSDMNREAHAHTVIGMALSNERKRSEAVAEFKLAVHADPNNVTAHLNLAEAYTRNGEDNLALEQARDVVRLDPNKPLSHRALGALLGRTHQPSEALKELRIAAQMEPQNPDNQTMMGSQLAGIYGHLDDAIAAFQEAVRLDPASAKAKDLLQKAQDLKARLAQELVLQRAAVQRDPRDANAYYRLARAEAHAGDLTAAIRDFQRSADLDPKNGTAHSEMAQVYVVRGDSANAWDEVRKARALGTEPPSNLISQLGTQK